MPSCATADISNCQTCQAHVQRKLQVKNIFLGFFFLPDLPGARAAQVAGVRSCM